jgi:hypothetical protein
MKPRLAAGGTRMDTVFKLISATTWSFVVGLFLVVTYQILTGKIEVKGLLRNGDGFSVNRVQLLMITIGGALYYLLQVVADPNVMAEPAKLPGVPKELLYVMGGSGLAYLFGQYRSLPPNRQATDRSEA